MCRLLGALAVAPHTLGSLLGERAVRQFRELSKFHDDGWGAAWTRSSGEVVCARTALAAYRDPGFQRHLDGVQSRLHLAHLRWASTGMSVVAPNVHPFQVGAVTLAHNGYIAPAEEVQELVTWDFRRQLRGTTDSERYCAIVAQHLAESGDLEAAILGAVEVLRDRFPRACLNALVTDGADLFVVNVNSSAASPISADGFDEDGRQAPIGHRTAYFSLQSIETPTSVVISSTGVTDGPWRPLPADSIVGYRLDQATVVRSEALLASPV